MNAALRLLYRGGAWLPASDAATIADFGLQHLRAFKKCAALSLQMRQPRFPVHSKAHMLHHTFRFLDSRAFKLTCQGIPCLKVVS